MWGKNIIFKKEEEKFKSPCGALIPPLCGLFKEVAEPDTQGVLLSVPFQED